MDSQEDRSDFEIQVIPDAPGSSEAQAPRQALQEHVGEAVSAPAPQAFPEQEVMLSDDISYGLEPKKIPAYGPFRQPLPEFQYMAIREPEENVDVAEDKPNACMCSKCKVRCGCLRLNSPQPYNSVRGGHYRLRYQRTIIFECGDECSCEETCRLRTSKRLHGDLELFYTCKEKGWGVRSKTPIPSGAAVCEFIGILRSLANEIDDLGENHYAMDINCLHDARQAKDDESGLGIHQAIRRKEGDAAPDREFTVDPAARGNIGRFVNHSCDPNLFTQCIAYRARDMALSAKQAHIVFFASRDIEALEELTVDYNPNGPQARPCLCRAKNCRGVLYF